MLGCHIVLLNMCYLEDWVQDKCNKCAGVLGAIRPSIGLEKLSLLYIIEPSII